MLIISKYNSSSKKNHRSQQKKMMTKTILKKFRQLMNFRNVNVYVLPRTDEHQSQYLSKQSERVAFLSGFTGSNAIALISNRQALLWTDGRYYVQAQKQLKKDWQMRKLVEGQKKWFQHIFEKYEPSKTNIQIDGRLISAKNAQQRKKQFQEKGFKINFPSSNLVDQVWLDKPNAKTQQIFLHEQWAGRSLTQKVQWIRNKISEKKGQGALFTDLGQIAWILNLRSNQIPYNPFFKSSLVILKQGGNLYLPKNHQSLSNFQIINHLKKVNIQLKQYEPQFCQKMLCQVNQLNYSTYIKIAQPIQWDGIGIYRAIRTEKQLNGFRRCHLVDGIAMAKFWSWRSKQEQVNQYDAACYLDNLRMQQKDNKGLSFPTISGGGPNGAIIHYHATKSDSSHVSKNMIHLVDSGGQYLDGTTDVTRAFHFGTPTSEEKDSYTRVLLGNLDIQRLKWPKSVKLTGKQIQILARRHLWKKGKQYGHGTGHGVGYFGSVHEGPVGISRMSTTPLQPNMIVTNQPGYYQVGKYGIRIQNMLVVRQIQSGIIGFQNLTLCPYDKNLIDKALLVKQDIDFINKYHQKVWEKLSPHLQQDLSTLNWLKNATQPLQI